MDIRAVQTKKSAHGRWAAARARSEEGIWLGDGAGGLGGGEFTPNSIGQDAQSVGRDARATRADPNHREPPAVYTPAFSRGRIFTDRMTTFSKGLSLLSAGWVLTFSNVSIPLTTRPNTVYCPSRLGIGFRQI